MATLRDYIAYLKQEKEELKQSLAAQGIQTNEEDTFTEMSTNVLDEMGTHLCIYAQPEEPEVKYGLWFKTDKVHQITGIEQQSKFKVSGVWNTAAGLPAIHTQMPLYRIVHNGYMYGFATNNCMRVSLKNPSVKEALALPKTSLGLSGAFNVALSSYSTLSVGAITVYNDEIYLLAASADLGPSNSTSLYNDIIKYNIANNSWAYVGSVTAPSNPTNPTVNSMVTVNNKIYMFGSGTRRSYACPYSASYWILDPSTNEVTGPFNGPQHRVGAGSVVAYQDRYIYMWSSGYQDGGNSTFYPRANNAVHCFDTQDNTWKALKASPLSFCGVHVFPFLHGDQIFLFGMIENGRYWGNISTSMRYLCYVYDIKTDTYRQLPNMGGLVGKVMAYYDEDQQSIVVSGTADPSWNGSVVTTTRYFSWFDNEPHPEGTVIFDSGLPKTGMHNISCYFNDKTDVKKFGIYFKTAYLWDETNNTFYSATLYKGDGEKWTKI